MAWQRNDGAARHRQPPDPERSLRPGRSCEQLGELGASSSIEPRWSSRSTHPDVIEIACSTRPVATPKALVTRFEDLRSRLLKLRSTPSSRSNAPPRNRRFRSSVATIRAVAETVPPPAHGRLATHTWRSASIGNLGGWQVARCALPAERVDRQRRHEGRDRHSTAMEQVRSPKPFASTAEAGRCVERTPPAGGVATSRSTR